jgi:uncharacterized protein
VLPKIRSSPRAIQNRFIALLKPPFKFSDDDQHVGRGKAGEHATADWQEQGQTGECVMARFEILDSDAAPLGEGPAADDMLFELGLMYSVGRDVPVDLVSAHKWFNLAAMKGNNEAIRLRREIACQMADAEIATAQRAARDWLRGKREPAAIAIAA